MTNEQIVKQIIELNNHLELTPDNFLVRADGRIEYICHHGVGHPVYSPKDRECDFIHGCCGVEDKDGHLVSCCSNIKTLPTIKDKYKKDDKVRITISTECGTVPEDTEGTILYVHKNKQKYEVEFLVPMVLTLDENEIKEV